MSNFQETIVLVEDEEAIGSGLKFNFEAEGYYVEWFQTGCDAIKYINTNPTAISLIVLDLMLPDMNGYEILKKTRDQCEKVPILVLSAKSTENDKIKAFELGADDYVTKPFGLAELILRIKRLIQKSSWYKNEENPKQFAIGHAFFFPERLVLQKPTGEHMRLSPLEGLLLKVFYENENKILSRGDLLEKVWNQERTLNTRTVDVFLSKLRKLIEPNPAQPQFLLSVRSVGYAYVTDAKIRNELVLL